MSELVLPKINKETISKKEYIFKNLAKIINPENVLSHAPCSTLRRGRECVS